MFIDASALVAILRQEDDGPSMEQRIVAAEGPRYVSPVVRFEATLSIARALSTLPELAPLSRSTLIAEAKTLVDDYLAEIHAQDIAIDFSIGEAALKAALSYGKVVGHKAALNMGDCFSYACAKAQNVTLLYKGNDFAHTDLA